MTPIASKAPRNWPAILVFAISGLAALTLVPWYGWVHGYSVGAWIGFGVVLSLNELSITCGYHRLFAHASYQARPALRLIYLLLGAMTLQNSALVWSANHRVHHRYVDDPERDPYCIGRGFWFAHMGWMLRHFPSGEPDFNTVRDLQRDRWVLWQHRRYLAIAAAMNLGVPLLVGLASGDVIAGLLLAGVLRLVLSHQLTFCINSLAHVVGRRPYGTEHTARDNALVALLTFGEGYHNYHHTFANDYRNAVRWWQWDPTKWVIYGLSKLGLAYNLHHVPRFRIQRALLDAQFRRAEQDLARQPAGQCEGLRARVAEEYAAFRAAVGSWTQLREQWLAQARHAAFERWERSLLQSRFAELENKLSAQYRRMRKLLAQAPLRAGSAMA